MKNQIIARAWVMEHGRDCDGGYTRGSVGSYRNLVEAQEGHQESSEWSDGMTYQLTEKWSEVVEYCGDYELEGDYRYADHDSKWDYAPFDIREHDTDADLYQVLDKDGKDFIGEYVSLEEAQKYQRIQPIPVELDDE